MRWNIIVERLHQSSAILTCLTCGTPFILINYGRECCNRADLGQVDAQNHGVS